MTKTIPPKKKYKKAKWLSEEASQIAVERTKGKSQGERERYSQMNTVFQRIARRDKKAFLKNGKKKTIDWEKTRDLFKKIGDTKGTFLARMGTVKDRKGKDLTEVERLPWWLWQ